MTSTQKSRVNITVPPTGNRRFTPDFTLSRVIRELKLVTCGGFEFVFVLNTSLPFHMLAECAETLPRPSWELELYIIVSLIMRLNEYSDSAQNSRGLYASSYVAARVGERQSNTRTLSNSQDSQDKRFRMGFGHSPMQAASSQLTYGSTTSGQEGPPAACQLTNRKACSTKQVDFQSQNLAGSSVPHRGLCADVQDYTNLVGAMDDDLNRREPLSAEALQEQSSQSVQSKVLKSKRKLRGKTKAQRKKEKKEKEKKITGKTQGEELKDNLADNDDSSYTTTETSTPDMESNISEEPVTNKGRTVTTGKVKEGTSNFLIKPKTKKQGTIKKETQAEKSSSLELPYITPLENKQRNSFTSKALHPFTNIPKTKPLQKKRFDGRLEDGCPSLLAKLLSSGGSAPKAGHSSSSEGEKELFSPEWGVPVSKNSVPESDSIQQISLQTINADPFLKRSAPCSPPPTSPSLLSRGTYSSVLNSNSEVYQRKAPGKKLSPATSLPGKNENPAFVAAGYDKNPGGSCPGKTDSQGKRLAHMTSVESDSSESSTLSSPIDKASSSNFHSANSFSAFGPNNSFNLSEVFSGRNLPKSSEPSWPEITPVPSSIWDKPITDTLNSWPSSSSSPTAPTASLLGNSHSPWSTTTSFGSSIWFTSTDSALHPFPPTTNTTTLTDLVNSSNLLLPASTEMSPTYNPWNMWRSQTLEGRIDTSVQSRSNVGIHFI
ncbi:transmembrane protein 131-like [Limanda limanda]|uniref:transmembrane protein 131-like n=1 Tax=Limanda limanda TaxID=27771 RepID=UPI0029C72668|nr:transmembrane protein 131-like [Limanda limanda]